MTRKENIMADFENKTEETTFDGIDGIDGISELTPEIMEAIAGGYDPNAYNPAALAPKMNPRIAEAKKCGESKENMLEFQILQSFAAHDEFGSDSPEYQLCMDRYRYIEENWDKI